jgi:twitching motility protein PilT
MNLTDLLIEAVRREASDLILTAGSPITYYVHGILEPHDSSHRLDSEECRELVLQLLTAQQLKDLTEKMELDFSIHKPDVGRFRVSVYHQRGGMAAVLRLIPFAIPHYTEIGIPEQLLMQMTTTPNGMILVTGPTGAGKSTTVASFIEYLNTESDFPRHVITIEDPIEFLFTPKSCVIDQREVGADTHSYVNGLRAALRQAPHIIFLGEMRDRETMEIALTAAETGNLIISTLSTQSAAKTINRIIDVFPIENQTEVRTRLALNLRLVVSQLLLRRSDIKGRIAAREILIVDNAVSNLIREGKIHQINNAIAGGAAKGMILRDSSILELYRQGVVQAGSVMGHLEDPANLKLVLSSKVEERSPA